jgi:hypothetical protein
MMEWLRKGFMERSKTTHSYLVDLTSLSLTVRLVSSEIEVDYFSRVINGASRDRDRKHCIQGVLSART